MNMSKGHDDMFAGHFTVPENIDVVNSENSDTIFEITNGKESEEWSYL